MSEHYTSAQRIRRVENCAPMAIQVRVHERVVSRLSCANPTSSPSPPLPLSRKGGATRAAKSPLCLRGGGANKFALGEG